MILQFNTTDMFAGIHDDGGRSTCIGLLQSFPPKSIKSKQLSEISKRSCALSHHHDCLIPVTLLLITLYSVGLLPCCRVQHKDIIHLSLRTLVCFVLWPWFQSWIALLSFNVSALILSNFMGNHVYVLKEIQNIWEFGQIEYINNVQMSMSTSMMFI